MESGLPDKEKQIYQADIEKHKATNVKLSEELNKTKAEYEEKIATLTKEKTDYIIGEEFAKRANAITNYVTGGGREGFETMFFSLYPKSTFEPFDYNGKIEFVNKEGKKMDDLVIAAKEKYPCFFVNNNQGGGAKGSTTAKPSVANPWAKETLNLTRQMEITRENPQLAESLMSAAGVKP